MDKVGQVVMPGEVVGTVDPEKTTKIGIGVVQNQQSLIATKCGILRSKGNHVWVDNRQKRVPPSVAVVVVVKRRKRWRAMARMVGLVSRPHS